MLRAKLVVGVAEGVEVVGERAAERIEFELSQSSIDEVDDDDEGKTV